MAEHVKIWSHVNDAVFTFRENLLRVDIYFGEMKFEEIVQVPSYDYATFFGKQLIHPGTITYLQLPL